MGIERNILVRFIVESVVDLIACDGITEDELLTALLQRQPKHEQSLPPDVMSDAEARSFGRQSIPYGEFSGIPVDEAPLDRLCWYADQRWTDELRRYLKSNRIREEMEL